MVPVLVSVAPAARTLVVVVVKSSVPELVMDPARVPALQVLDPPSMMVPLPVRVPPLRFTPALKAEGWATVKLPPEMLIFSKEVTLRTETVPLDVMDGVPARSGMKTSSLTPGRVLLLQLKGLFQSLSPASPSQATGPLVTDSTASLPVP